MTACSDLDLTSMPRSAQMAEGSVIGGKYQVERLIGVGGMGVVVSALHLALERRVAIKIVREELAEEESVLQRFLLEAKAAAKLSNEHVCKVLDVGRLDSGLPFIVMELLEGRDLGAILEERHAVEPIEAVDWVIQACDGLARAHAAGIVHRDLKPENLFLHELNDGSGCIKILDFGISKQLGERSVRKITGPLGVVGSPRYMAPEQLMAAEVDERSDIWSLGAILYELLTGVPAFAAENLASLRAKVLAAAPVPPRKHRVQLPAGLERALLRCLRRERAGRFRDVAELALALAPYGSDLGRYTCERIRAHARSPSGHRKLVALGLTLTVLGLTSLLSAQRSVPGRPLQPGREQSVLPLSHDVAASPGGLEPAASTSFGASSPAPLTAPAKPRPAQPAGGQGAPPPPHRLAHSVWAPEQAWDVKNFGGRL